MQKIIQNCVTSFMNDPNQWRHTSQVEEGEPDLYTKRHSSNYSLAGFKISFRRNSLRYLTNYYLPSGMFVVVSWVTTVVDIVAQYFCCWCCCRCCCCCCCCCHCQCCFYCCCHCQCCCCCCCHCHCNAAFVVVGVAAFVVVVVNTAYVVVDVAAFVVIVVVVRKLFIQICFFFLI